MTNSKDLEEQLGHRFGDRRLLRQALTHRSAERDHNERLEFLGDAVLGAVIAEALYHRFPNASEGDLSRLRASLVNRQTLAQLARELGINERLRLGTGERKSGGAQRPAMLCDALEAVLGAVHLDGGPEVCRRVIMHLFESRLQQIHQWKDPKTRLQELVQAEGAGLPEYEVVTIDGEEHAQTFTVYCRVALLDGETSGSGGSRRQAERDAAARALELLGERAAGERS